MAQTLSEKILASAGTGGDPTELDLLESVTATAAELNILDGVTATAAEINMAADNSANVETVTATNVIGATESGKVFFLDAVAGFTSTLPAPSAGLRFKFIVKTAPTSNGYTIATNGGDDIMVVGINELEVDTTEDGPYDDNADTLVFVANVAVAGDWVEFVSDGTKWYGTGQTNADGGVTTSTT